jgi:membrane-bound lytic murein transglycosylase B
VTARQPRHAQPSVLAGLRWSSATQWVCFALLVALGLGILATVDAPAHPAAARAAAPPAAVTTDDSTGQVDADAPFAEQPPAGVSIAPTPTTFFRPPAGLLNNTQASSLAADGIPTTALLAYQQAADREALLHPACGLPWPLLAGIGRAESNHGRFAGAVLHSDGVSIPRIIGIPLNGNGTARILDTDNGILDGDAIFDRAVGPMQFIPSTWEAFGVDANDDGLVDPFNIFDAAAGAAKYLCAAGGNLRTLAGQLRAVRVYNDSDAYITLVLQLEAIYASGVPGLTVPVVPTDPTPSPPHVNLPPVNPGPPLGVPPKKPKPKPKPPTKSPSPSRTRTTPNTPGSSSATATEAPCSTPSPTSSTSASDTASPTASTTTSATPSPSPTGTDCPTPTPTPTDSTTDTATPTPSDSSTTPEAPTSSGSTSASSPGDPGTTTSG